jgi:hypothetical protein
VKKRDYYQVSVSGLTKEEWELLYETAAFSDQNFAEWARDVLVSRAVALAWARRV